MPEVLLRRNEGYIDHRDLKRLIEALQHIVSKAFNAVGGNPHAAPLTKDNVTVRDMIHGSYDVGIVDLEITVTANDFEPEERSVGMLRKKIIEGIMQIKFKHSEIEAGRNAIWIILVPGTFAEF